MECSNTTWRWIFCTVLLIIGFSTVLAVQHHCARQREEIHQAEMRIIAKAICDCEDVQIILDWDGVHPLRIFVRSANQDYMKEAMEHAIKNMKLVCDDETLIRNERARRALEEDVRAKETDSP